MACPPPIPSECIASRPDLGGLDGFAGPIAIAASLVIVLAVFVAAPSHEPSAAGATDMPAGVPVSRVDLAEPYGVLDLWDIDAFIAEYTTDPSALPPLAEGRWVWLPVGAELVPIGDDDNGLRLVVAYGTEQAWFRVRDGP
ncbi:MAG: hypothetical protein AAGI53_01595 [Planctomycetota bacterium]